MDSLPSNSAEISTLSSSSSSSSSTPSATPSSSSDFVVKSIRPPADLNPNVGTHFGAGGLESFFPVRLNSVQIFFAKVNLSFSRNMLLVNLKKGDIKTVVALLEKGVSPNFVVRKER
jgi:hypothetical protein